MSVSLLALAQEARLLEEHDRTRMMLMLVVNELLADSSGHNNISYINNENENADSESKEQDTVPTFYRFHDFENETDREVRILGSNDNLHIAYDELFIFVNHLFRAFYPESQPELASFHRVSIDKDAIVEKSSNPRSPREHRKRRQDNNSRGSKGRNKTMKGGL